MLAQSNSNSSENGRRHAIKRLYLASKLLHHSYTESRKEAVHTGDRRRRISLTSDIGGARLEHLYKTGWWFKPQIRLYLSTSRRASTIASLILELVAFASKYCAYGNMVTVSPWPFCFTKFPKFGWATEIQILLTVLFWKIECILWAHYCNSGYRRLPRRCKRTSTYLLNHHHQRQCGLWT